MGNIMIVNTDGIAYAKQLLEQGMYRLSTPWRTVQPSETAARKFWEQQGAADYARWHLALDPAQPEGSPERYLLPLGDFKSIHRSGIVAARDRAEREGAADVRQAVEDILDLFDRMNAC